MMTTVNEPLELARRLHDTVAQRLAGLSYLLSTSEPCPEALAFCRSEVDAALYELRDALTTVGSGCARSQRAEALAELERFRQGFPEVSLTLALDDLMDTEPRNLVCAFLGEGLRNVRKHSSPSHVSVTVLRDAEVGSIAIFNDGVSGRPGPSCGAGRRLLELEASLHGGLVESVPAGPGCWCQRLILPAAEFLGG
jgi:signal transduction histidine kinase